MKNMMKKIGLFYEGKMKRFYVLSLLLLFIVLPLWAGTITETITFEKSALVFSKVNGCEMRVTEYRCIGEENLNCNEMASPAKLTLCCKQTPPSTSRLRWTGSAVKQTLTL